MVSEAPRCGGGLSGNCLLIIHFLFQFLKTPNPTFFLQISNISPPHPHLNLHFLKFPNNYWTKDCNLIESFLAWMKSLLDIWEKGWKSTKIILLTVLPPYYWRCVVFISGDFEFWVSDSFAYLSPTAITSGCSTFTRVKQFRALRFRESFCLRRESLVLFVPWHP